MNFDRQEDFAALGADISTLQQAVLTQSRMALTALSFPDLALRCIISFDDTVASPFVSVIVYVPSHYSTVRVMVSIGSLTTAAAYRAKFTGTMRHEIGNISEAAQDAHAIFSKSVR